MSWDKYGSPYDPNYRGSGKIPFSAQAARGCGDPNCMMCNPDTAGKGLSSPSGAGAPSIPSIIRDYASPSLIDEIMNRALRSSYPTLALPLGFDGSNQAQSNQVKKSPPAAYTEARKAVEKWLGKAPEQDFSDIAGNEVALEQLRDAIQAPVKHKDLYAAYGMKMPKGAMLSGPPGCGKTMFARAAAAEMKRLYGDAVEFISISGSELQSPYVGVTEGYIKAIFTFAREYKAYHGHPLLVFMDEADVLLPDRTGRVRRVASWEESQVATFLAEMDGMQESGAFMLLATNRPEVIDQAVLRDGRCDFKIVVKRPEQEAVAVILRNNFTGILTADCTIDDLIFAAVECLYDPAKIIAEAHAVGLDLGKLELSDRGHKHFLLEHIVSGAMAASIPNRAKRYAFARDKADGVARGVTVADVVAAVNDVFEENKGLDHSFALNEFKASFMAEVNAAMGKGGAA